MFRCKKLHAVVARHTFNLQVKMLKKKVAVLGHFLQQLHAVVARSAFPSQNAKKIQAIHEDSKIVVSCQCCVCKYSQYSTQHQNALDRRTWTETKLSIVSLVYPATFYLIYVLWCI